MAVNGRAYDWESLSVDLVTLAGIDPLGNL